MKKTLISAAIIALASGATYAQEGSAQAGAEAGANANGAASSMGNSATGALGGGLSSGVSLSTENGNVNASGNLAGEGSLNGTAESMEGDAMDSLDANTSVNGQGALQDDGTRGDSTMMGLGKAEQTVRRQFDRLDTDRDRVISSAEASSDVKTGFSANFSSADSDGDGRVTQAEFASFFEGSSKTMTR